LTLASSQSNPLLYQIVRFLNGHRVTFNDLVRLIDEATPGDVIPAAAYLVFWTNRHREEEEMNLGMCQTAYHLAELIASKVGPFFILSGMFDLNWNAASSENIRSEFIRSLCLRLSELALVCGVYTLPSPLLRRRQCFVCKAESFLSRYPGMRSEIEVNALYRKAISDNFETLILSHEHISAFKPLFECRGYRSILTQTLIDMIQKLNRIRKITHGQLFYMFDSIFLYVQAFASQNDIDVQLLGESIRNSPFVSPFCLLALMNHCPPSISLFGYIVPPAILRTDFDDADIPEQIRRQYSIIDRSLDNSLVELVKLVPGLFISFLRTQRWTPPQNPILPDIAHLLDIIWNGTPQEQQVKKTLDFLGRHEIQPVAFAAFNSAVVRRILSLLRSSIAVNLRDGRMTHQAFVCLAHLFGSALVALPDSLTPLDLEFRDKAHAECLVRWMQMTFVKYLAGMPIQNRLLPWLVAAMKQPGDLRTAARILLTQLLRCSPPRLTADLAQAILNCGDQVLLVEYWEALQDMVHVDQNEERAMIDEFRSKIYKLLWNSPEPTSDYLVTKTQAQAINVFLNWERNGSLLESDPTVDSMLALRVLICSEAIRASELTRSVVKYVMTLLRGKKGSRIGGLAIKFSDPRAEPLYIQLIDVLFPVCQVFLKYLLITNHVDLAVDLLEAMAPHLVNGEPMPLSWIALFLGRNFRFLDASIARTFEVIVMQLPDASEFFIRGITPDYVGKMMELFAAVDTPYTQDPSFLKNREIRCPVKYVSTFCQISILLRYKLERDVRVVLADLLKPFGHDMRLLENRRAACFHYAAMIAGLPSTIGWEFISRAISNANEAPPNAFVWECLRHFVALSPLDLYLDLCNRAAILISATDTKLHPFMFLVMPYMDRLKFCPTTASALAGGLLKSISKTTPSALQECVIDAVGSIYVIFRLGAHRGELIAAAQHLDDHLKISLASSLDVDLCHAD
jgi:hypothetical protein